MKTECSHCHKIITDGKPQTDCPDPGCMGTQFRYTKPGVPWTHRGGKSHDIYRTDVRPYANEKDDETP